MIIYLNLETNFIKNTDMKPKINRFILKKGCFNMDLLNENHAQEQKPIKGKKTVLR